MILKKSQFFILVLICIGFVGCNVSEDETPTLIVGEDFTNTNIRVISIDTFTIKMSTMKFEEIETTNSERILFGRYQDDDFGDVTASSYFQLSAFNYFIDDDAVMDRVELIMGYDNYFFNDTTQTLNLNVHKITERFDTEGDEPDFYNNSTLEFDILPLASLEFEPEPNEDSLYVELPFDFGLDLFEKIQDNDITDNESLNQELRGLTIQPNETDNGSIIGFNPNNIKLRFFFNIFDDTDNEEQEFDLTLNPSSSLSYFNNIQSDVNALVLNDITDQEYNLSSTDSNNSAYLQSGVGYASRIEFPTIKNIFELEGTGTVMNAVLTIKPNRSSYSDLKPVEETLALFIVDQNNDLREQVSNALGFVFADFSRENEEFGDSVYEVPVLEYIDRKLNEAPETEEALILIPEEYNSRVNGILLNDAFNENFEAKLTITYAIYED